VTLARDNIIKIVWRGNDPFAGFPEGLYEYDSQGWHSDHPYLTTSIERLEHSLIIVEVGVWKGGSVITMADKLRTLGRDGVVIAVDTWLGSWDHWINDHWFRDLSFSHGRPMIQSKFMNNIIQKKLTEFVVPFPLDSINAVNVIKRYGISPNLIHIDGGHDYSAVLSDLAHWWPLLATGGFLVGDDYHDPNWPEVTQAFDKFFKSKEDIVFEHGGCKCRIQKIR
jgi:hypothetical protein